MGTEGKAAMGGYSRTVVDRTPSSCCLSVAVMNGKLGEGIFFVPKREPFLWLSCMMLACGHTTNILPSIYALSEGHQLYPEMLCHGFHSAGSSDGMLHDV